MKYINIRNLNYYYPRSTIRALNNIRLTINKGEIVFIAGKSGSGKSTLAKCISGSIPNFYGGKISGEISINDVCINKISNSDRSKEITMVFQDPERQLLMNKVHREIAFGLENIAVEAKNIKRRVFEALQFSNILDLAYRDISTLSGGEKQKVAIASAIAYLPRCIILDEPTSQLDPAAAEEIIKLIKKVNEELGITIIIIEQRIDKWFDIADRILVMKEGNIGFSGDKKTLYNIEDKYIRDFLPSYMKFSKFIGMDKMPLSFKDARLKIEKLGLNLKERKRENINFSNILIQIKKLTCGYENISVLKNVSLDIKEGEFISVLGANGSGKSTLLKAIMGVIKYKGSIKVLEEEVKKIKTRNISKKIGYVSQNPNDYISKDTVYDELKFTLDNYGIKNYEIIDETLKRLDIYEIRDKNPRDISSGERQRVAIASILVMKPKILILDEPTRGLDYNVKINLGETLKDLNDKGTTIIMVTHDIEFAAKYCTKFTLMFNGEIVCYGNSEDVLGEGIYYTTEINKLVRSKNPKIFTLDDVFK
ncbi:ABC transporter ATP-binding protein [Clostridium brassicae]|uniref:Energy-coupling factor transporter ATPase n=1 Tax=Clostridium brassicae TaxID=2999072 RepID=A0ABT4D7K3_9CLOT|nr:energy-coupling factor transporter ATPase [Clostridium brassicae]MCY6957663.1 energy-coupling factor transporter ATPase [Clostridium brassicae]